MALVVESKVKKLSKVKIEELIIKNGCIEGMIKQVMV